MISNGRPSWSLSVSSLSTVVLQDFVVLVFWIVFDSRHDFAVSDEPRQVIDVPIGIVAGDSFAEPADMSSGRNNPSDIARSACFERCGLRFLFSRQDGGREDGSRAVEIDRAAFHDDPG